MPTKIALVTGASAGIGRALALEFSKHGYGLLLVSRDAAKLAEVARECGGQNVYYVAQDLSTSNGAKGVYEFARNKNLEISVVVNNAGFGVHGEFADSPLEKELELLRLQLDALLQLTKYFLPSMIERRDGHFLNVASVYSFVPVPQQSVYGACKSFMLSFSQSLAAEVERHNVRVTVVCPGVTQSEFRKRAGIREKKPGSGMTSEQVAKIAFAGLQKNKRVVLPGFWINVFVAVVRMLPLSGVVALVRVINRARGVDKKH